MADGIYERVSGLLGIGVKRRIPVSITPHTDEFNGYMNPVPYPHIFLFDTPENLEWTSYDDTLESLFLHELVHAVSGSSRSPFFNFLHTVFGGWAYPVGLTANWGMIEGSAVGFESLDGKGRANDPLIKTRLREDIIEGKWKTAAQAFSGFWDRPPAGSTYYEYGGLFCSFLIENYGMEKFGQLWRELGKFPRVSFFYYSSGFYARFQKVYGKKFLRVWDDFEDSLTIDDVLDNDNVLIYGGNDRQVQIASITATAPTSSAAASSSENSYGKKVFFLDKIAGGVFQYVPVDNDGNYDNYNNDDGGGAVTKKQKPKFLFAVPSSAYSIDASKDGAFILVSHYLRNGAMAGQLSRAVVDEYDVRRRVRTGRRFYGFYNAAYFRDGIVGRKSDLHASNIVYKPFGNGKASAEEEILLCGSAELLFSNPKELSRDKLVFTSAKNGIREISIYDYSNNTVGSLHSGLPDDLYIWTYLRDMQVSGSNILFSYNSDEKLYKLGVIDAASITGAGGIQNRQNTQDGASAITATFSENNFAGSVFAPVAADGEIYYRAAYSPYDALYRLNENIDSITGRKAALSLVPWEERWLEIAGIGYVENNEINAAAEDAALSSEISNVVVNEGKPFWGIKYLNPLNLWLPYPYIRLTDKSIDFAGAGIFSYMSDPMDDNLIFLSAAYDFKYIFAPLDLTWNNYAFGFTLQTSFTDTVEATTTEPYRAERLTVAPSYSFNLPFLRGTFSLGASFSLLNTAYKEDDDSDAAYTWANTRLRMQAGASLSYSQLRRYAWQQYGNGFSLSAVYKQYVDPVNIHRNRYEAQLRAALESRNSFLFAPAFNFVGYGIYDENKMNLYGRGGWFSPSVISTDNAITEYHTTGIQKLTYLAGGIAEYRILNLEIQGNLSHIYYSRAYLSAGAKGVYYGNQAKQTDSQYALSAYLRLGADIKIAPLSVAVITLKPLVTASYKFQDLRNNDKDKFAFAANVGISY
ncbi:hypothetical protein AGMMS50225_24260 [Betaproteobacteria bacterium]|nr:hypothetical protein AGMMS50225_24260 [Betaproteobacteria bacterium]